MLRINPSFLFLALCALPSLASAASLGDLARTALAAGHASGIVDSGEIVTTIQAMTRSTAPLEVEIRKLKDYPNGCGRLSVMAKLSSVPTVDGGSVPFAQGFELDLCPDGSVPSQSAQH